MIKCQLAVILGQRRANSRGLHNYSSLARATGLSYGSISNLANNKTTRYDAHVLDALCRVLDVGVGDLLVYVVEGDETEELWD